MENVHWCGVGKDLERHQQTGSSNGKEAKEGNHDEMMGYGESAASRGKNVKTVLKQKIRTEDSGDDFV